MHKSVEIVEKQIAVQDTSPWGTLSTVLWLDTDTIWTAHQCTMTHHQEAACSSYSFGTGHQVSGWYTPFLMQVQA